MVSEVSDKNEIYNFLSRNKEVNIYSIGDLDDFFWPHTKWFVYKNNGEIKAIALLYTATENNTLLSFYDTNKVETGKLLSEIKPKLPQKIYTHLSPGLLHTIFGEKSIIQDNGPHKKMALRKTPPAVNDSNIRFLKESDEAAIKKLYEVAYPANWFDKRMLLTGKYVGYFQKEQLIGIAGIHVYSEKYKVAALGNITTHPNFRGQRIGYKLTAALCNDLRRTVDTIGLNVKATNEIAIHCYEKVGFEIIAEFNECLVSNN
jgi:ribosomal protein S18 acetylase RimI-like enzyme